MANRAGLIQRHGLLTLLVLLLAAALWINHRTIADDPNTLHHTHQLLYLEDATGTLSSNDIVQQRALFTKASGNSLNFGLTSSVYWIWLTIEQPDNTIPTLLLEVGYPHLDFLDVYQPDDNATRLHYRLGDSVPFHARPVKDRKFVIPVHFTDNTSQAEVLLRVESQGTLQLPLSVKTPETYQAGVRTEQLILGLYYGILIGVMAYNFLLAVGLKEQVYYYYCGYAVCQSLFQFIQNGMAFEYLWPDWTYLNQIAIPLMAALSLLLSVRFTHLFLNITPTSSPRLFIGYRVTEYLFAGLAVATLFVDRTLMIILMSMACAIGGVFMFITALVFYIRGDQNAKFYLLAWSLLIFGVVIYSARAMGLIRESFFSVHSVQIGSVIEMILLSYALADRFNRLRDENIKVQREAKASLEENVRHRTKELNDTLRQLKLANNQLESINQRDPLTNIFNRGYFNDRLRQVWNDMAAVAQPVSLMMIDIDHFKAINDTRGHLVGDEVIIRLARTIDALCQNTNCIPARFGGEEFIVLLPSCNSESAWRMAEQLRKDVEKIEFLDDVRPDDRQESNVQVPKDSATPETFTITISLGISTETPMPHSARSGLQLVDQADKALYNAKQSGRNRCCVYQHEDTDIGKAA